MGLTVLEDIIDSVLLRILGRLLVLFYFVLNVNVILLFFLFW